MEGRNSIHSTYSKAESEYANNTINKLRRKFRVLLKITMPNCATASNVDSDQQGDLLDPDQHVF